MSQEKDKSEKCPNLNIYGEIMLISVLSVTYNSPLVKIVESRMLNVRSGMTLLVSRSLVGKYHSSSPTNRSHGSHEAKLFAFAPTKSPQSSG